MATAADIVMKVYFSDGSFRTIPESCRTAKQAHAFVYEQQKFPNPAADYGLFEQSKDSLRIMGDNEALADVEKLWGENPADACRFVFRLADLSPPGAKQGFLTKQGHFVKNWKRRWYRMIDDLLLYFRNKKDTTPAGCVPLRGARISVAPEKIKKKNCFLLVTADGGEHYAYADSAVELEDWMGAIKLAIEHLSISDLEFKGLERRTIRTDSEMRIAAVEKGAATGSSPLAAGGSATSAASSSTSSASSSSGGAGGSSKNIPGFGDDKMTIDDFELLRVLGKGSFGKVMLGRKKGEEKLYAIKILKKDMVLENEELEHTKTERAVLQTSDHPFLVKMYYSFQSEDRLYFVMDYVNGGELFYHMQRDGRFDEERVKFYAAEIVCAIGYLHSRGIVYRDLKLENLLLDREGHILLTDFGLCKENVSFGNTTNTFCGTPEYLAPEVVEDEDYGIPVDWWSLGIVLYEMLTGRSPFSSGDHEELFRQILEAQIYYPTSLSAGAKSLLQALLIRNPKERLGSGAADAADIKAHEFFAGIDFNLLEARGIKPPFVPNVGAADDVTNFDPVFTSEPVGLTPAVKSALSESQQGAFDGFTYVSGSAISQAQ